MSRIFAAVMLMLSLVCSASEVERSELDAKVLDPNYDCQWKTQPTVIDFSGERFYMGAFDCKYLPKPLTDSKNPPARGKDHELMGGCKVEEGDKPFPTPKGCVVRNEKSEPKVLTRGGYVVEKKNLKPEDQQVLDKDQEEGKRRFGKCTYSNSPYAVGSYLQYTEGYAFLCSSPVTCEGGPEKPKEPLAVCAIQGEPITVPTKNKKGKMEDVKYPVCPPPEACLVRSERDPELKIVDTKKKASNDVGVSRMRARNAPVEQIASTLAPRTGFGLNTGSTHLYQ